MKYEPDERSKRISARYETEPVKEIIRQIGDELKKEPVDHDAIARLMKRIEALVIGPEDAI